MIKNFFYRCLFLYLCLSAFPAQAEIQSDRDLQIDRLASDLPVAWGMTELPDNTLLISLREGKLVRLNPSTGERIDISGIAKDIFVGGQAGLFDVALAPDFTQSSWIYFSYSKDLGGKSATTLARAKLSAEQLSEWQDLLVTNSASQSQAHFGGRIVFDGNGHLFLSVGERGHRPNAQDLTNHAGKILRLHLDGSVPADNPFVGNANVLPEIWSYGHRNPQGLYFNQQTQQLWEIEHGPRGGDEINLIHAGHNYGWPVISYGKEYWAPLPVGKGTHREGMDQPIQTYIPSIAPSSLIQYQGELFKGWKGNLLAGALSLQHLNRVVIDSQSHVIAEFRLLDTLANRIRNVIEGRHGELYIGTDEGYLYRITPKSQ